MNGNGLKYLDLAGNGLKWLDWAMTMRMTIWVMDDQIRSPMTMLFTNYMHFQYIINEYIKGGKHEFFFLKHWPSGQMLSIC